jgi:hypothetical protein
MSSKIDNSAVLLKEHIRFLVQTILKESKQNIMNLGFPEVIASLFFERFGKHAFLMARWFREYHGYGYTDKETRTNYSKDWWWKSNKKWSRSELDIVDIVDLYEAGKTSKEAYDEVRERLELNIDPEDDFDPRERLPDLKEEIKEILYKDVFFVFTLIEDIESKKITNLQPYKDLSFSEAKDRYDNIRIFDTKQLIKIYKNGWKWIDVGNRCQLVGKLMKNCGSAGVMSWDEDKTILTLFDKNNKPHVVVTYSPNEKRISGDEGAASTEVKGKYHRYILDLAEHLG